MRKLIAGALLAAAAVAPFTAATAQDDARPTYADQRAETIKLADAYMSAYIALDWDALEPLLADDASFADPTAELVFGNAPAEGKDAMIAKFRKGYASISRMSLLQDRAVYGGNIALYEGTLSWTLHFRDGNVLDSKMPYVAIIRVEDGKVVSHRDYGDYTPFIAGMRALKAPGEGA